MAYNIGVFGIIEISGKVLLLPRRDAISPNLPAGTLELPGGTLDQGEEYPKATLYREVWEETGLNLNTLEESGYCRIIPYASFHKNGLTSSFYYRVTIDSNCLSQIEAQLRNFKYEDSEHTGFRFLDCREINGLKRQDILPLHRDAILVASKEVQEYTGIDGDLKWYKSPSTIPELSEGTYALSYR